MVKVVLGNVNSQIVGYLPDEVQKDLDKTLSYKVQNARYIPRVRKKQWDGVFHLYKRSRGQTFYTGLLSFVREVLNAHNIEHVKIDNRCRPEINLPDLKFDPPKKFEERDYQDFTINRALQFTRGILSVCTGGGKTVIVTRLIADIKTGPFMFYVLTKDLMEQAHDTLSYCLNEPIGKIGDGKAIIHNINVCTIQTAIRALHAHEKNFKIDDYVFDDEDVWDEKAIENITKADKIAMVIKQAKGLYFDETHHAAAKMCQEVLTASPDAYWRYGGSATPYREDGADIMLQAMFGAKVVEIPASYLIESGYLLPPHIFFEDVDHGVVPYHSWRKIESECITRNDMFNNHVADTANHLVSRGLSTLILVKYYPQGDYLKELIPNSIFVTGKMSGKKRKKYIQDLRDKKIMCMIATSLADEGLDIPTLDAAILAGGGASASRINQRIGRTLRIDLLAEQPKDKSIVIIYNHKGAKYLGKHTRKIKKLLKREPKFVLKNSKGPEFICQEIDRTIGIKSKTPNLFDV